MSSPLALGFLVTIVLLGGCSCHGGARGQEPGSAISIGEEARGAGDVAAGMVVYRDPQTGEIIDSPADSGEGAIDTTSSQPASAQPPKVEALPGGGVMIKTDQSMHPY